MRADRSWHHLPHQRNAASPRHRRTGARFAETARRGDRRRRVRWLDGAAPAAARGLALWRENEKRWGRPLDHRTGVLWLFPDADDYARSSLPALAAKGVTAFEVAPAEAARRWPQISLEGIQKVFFEPEAGCLMARRACETVLEAIVSEGVGYAQAAIAPMPEPFEDGACVTFQDGRRLKADVHVFACGPWLGVPFPALPGRLILSTRQKIFYFGTPAGAARYDEAEMPVRLEMGKRILHGIPGNEHRGFKIAGDTRGDPFDPTGGDRTPSAEGIGRARRALPRRLPGLSGAPMVAARVRQHENSPDGDFIIDRQPRRSDL